MHSRKYEIVAKSGRTYMIETTLEPKKYLLYLEEPNSFLIVKSADGHDIILPKSEIESIKCK